MATATFIPVETYLRTSYEPDAEYVDGEIEERPMGEHDHAAWQKAILLWFAKHEQEWGVEVLPSYRVQVAATRFRVPDVTVVDFASPVERIATRPPIAVFEVLSPEDTVLKIRRKLADYAKMGIPQIWVIDPEDGASLRYLDGELLRGEVFEEPSRGISFRIEEIGELVRR
jgi:Uma2 family endonuclease